MQVDIRVRGYSKELLVALLAAAGEMDLPISVVRSTPNGLYIPIELAAKVGILEIEVPAPAKPKRTRTKVKPGFNAEPAQTEALWEE